MMVPGVEVVGAVGAQILANVGTASIRGMLKRRKAKKRELEDAESTTNPVRVGSQELAEPENLSKVMERVERLEQRQQDERIANVLSVLEKTVEALADKEVSGQQPDSRWISLFTESAQHASTDELQDTWARILAGETERPGSISVRTLNTLNGLDQTTARLFIRLCSMAMYISLSEGEYLDYRVPSLEGSAASNSLQDYGISFDNLNMLNEHGLVISDYNSLQDYGVCIAGYIPQIPLNQTALGFTYQGKNWGLVPDGEREHNQEFQVNGVALTRTGRELARVVELEPVPKYEEALVAYFSKNGLTMVPRVGLFLQFPDA